MVMVFDQGSIATIDLEPEQEMPPFASPVGSPNIGMKLIAGDGMSPGTCAVWGTDRGGVRYDGLPGRESGFVVSGRARITADGAEPIEIGPGEGFVLPAGWSGTFEALEPLRKVFYLLA
ncbi:MAG: cupin domain-containing protein [Nocardioidaceae bacterium]